MAEQQQDDAQERTEKATPRKLEQAREKGQVARSRELSTTAVLLVSAAGFALTGPALVERMVSVMTSSLRLPWVGASVEVPLPTLLLEAVLSAFGALTPFLVLVMIVGIGSSAALGGIAFSSKALSFKWEKLDPVKGMKRVFSVTGLMELAKALAKFVIVTGTAIVVLWLGLPQMLPLSRQPIDIALSGTMSQIMFSFLCLAAATGLIALVDVPFQLWNHARQMRMTRREVKEELKETEGKPEVKSKVRGLQREIAQRRMMEAVPEADVVVTNPTHFAVALSYKPETMQAPRLVAKGADLLAARIRDVAGRHDVPVVEAPMLARAVYYSTKLDTEIPVGLYVAVAQVLAYVYRVREWTGVGERPVLSDELPIPDELKR